jgi:hypothetical protein
MIEKNRFYQDIPATISRKVSGLVGPKSDSLVFSATGNPLSVHAPIDSIDLILVPYQIPRHLESPQIPYL